MLLKIKFKLNYNNKLKQERKKQALGIMKLSKYCYTISFFHIMKADI